MGEPGACLSAVLNKKRHKFSHLNAYLPQPWFFLCDISAPVCRWLLLIIPFLRLLPVSSFKHKHTHTWYIHMLDASPLLCPNMLVKKFSSTSQSCSLASKRTLNYPNSNSTIILPVKCMSCMGTLTIGMLKLTSIMFSLVKQLTFRMFSFELME